LVVNLFVSKNAVCQEVILVRHAKVYLETNGWMGHKKAAQLRKSYDSAPIYPFSTDSVLNKLPARKTDTIYVSILDRSIGTGWQLFGDSAVVLSTPFLNEFELEIVKLPLLLPYKGWTAISRLSWALGGRNNGKETHREAKERVKQIADFIEDKTNKNEQVIFVTHGFLNRNIARELKRRDWQITKNEGKENLGATVLTK